jgi:hypothetical protein
LAAAAKDLDEIPNTFAEELVSTGMHVAGNDLILHLESFNAFGS